MKICSSQFRSSADVQNNVERHVAVVRRAAARGCRFVLFPELSLTGYEPMLAYRQAFSADDPRLQPLQAECDEVGVVVACGAPLRVATGVEIGMVVLTPSVPAVSYAKQRLHPDEERFFVAGTRQADIMVEDHRIAPAICYESLHMGHGAAAVHRGATVYAASVAKPEGAIDRAHGHYAALAAEHAVFVVVSNAIGPSDDFVAAGRSAAWGPDGVRVAMLDATSEGELVVEL